MGKWNNSLSGPVVCLKVSNSQTETTVKFQIGPGAYIFQRPFLRGLFFEGLIFGGAYLRREICVSKSIGLACSGKEIYHFCFVLLCIRGQIPSTSSPGGLYSEGWFNGGFFALRFWGAYIWRGLNMEGLSFGILWYFKTEDCKVTDTISWKHEYICIKSKCTFACSCYFSRPNIGQIQ